MRILVPVVVVVGTLLALLVWSQQRSESATVSGFVESDEIRVGSRVGGRVRAVQVEEGMAVEPGTLLVELEPFDLVERHADMAGRLAQARAQSDLARAGFRPEEIAEVEANRAKLAADLARLVEGPRSQEIATQSARVALDEALLELARAENARIEELFARGVASATERDSTLAKLRAAEADLEVQRQELALLLEGTRAEEIAASRALLAAADARLELVRSGSRIEDIARAEGAVASAQAALAAVDAQLAELRIVAPIAAIVEAVDIRPGDVVGPNQPILTLTDPSRLWVRAYVPENRLDVQVGKELDVVVDSFPGRTFPGRVGFVARHAEFTPGNVQTPEERSKQVFRIKIVLLDGLDVLRAGMAADVRLNSTRGR